MKTRKVGSLFICFIFLFTLTTTFNLSSGNGRNLFIMAPPSRYCTITSPSNGATVSGIVTITVDASGTPTIFIDGERIVKAYTYDWDSTTYSDGSHTITAKAPGVSDTISVTVNNGGGNNPPVVTITNPADGATVSGIVTITVEVTDEETLTPDIYIDNELVATAYSYDWDTTTYNDGSHDIYAEATDTDGLTGSDTNSVTVDNSGSGNVKLPWWNDVIDVEKQAYTGAGTVVVIIDTGLVREWKDYFPEENILSQYCRSYTKELRKDNVDWNKDTEGHGTAVTATIIGYNLITSTKTYWITGVAEDTKIVMLRCLYWIGGWGRQYVSEQEMLDNWADCINYARSLHQNELFAYNMIISMSLGYDETNTNLNDAIDTAENDGIVVCVSAGNSGPAADTTGYPANLADTTSVGACGHDGFTGQYGLTGIWTDIPEDDFSGVFLSDFSSRGKVDVVAIGENLVLPYSDDYYYISGTSFSCPQTSGVYALMFEAFGSQTVSILEEHLQSTAADLGYSVTEQGAGFIQADAATT